MPDNKKKTNDSTPSTDLEYKSVDIQTFTSGAKNIEFDVYLKIGPSKFAKIFSKTTGVDYRRINTYVGKGVKELFISKWDILSFETYSKIRPEDILKNENASTRERVSALMDLTNQGISQIYDMTAVSAPAGEKSKEQINTFIKNLEAEPSVVAEIVRNINRTDFFFFHSITVSIFSMLIAERYAPENKEFKEHCGLAGLLHDIGKSKLPEGIQNVVGSDLHPEYKMHTKYALRMLDGCQAIPAAVKQAVFQHHEEPGGNGFPNRIRDAKISTVAKVVAVANAFVNQIIPQGKKGISAEQAISNMVVATGKFDNVVLQVASELFTPQRKTKIAA